MVTEEYKLLDGRTIRVKYDRLGMCKISGKNMEAFVKEFNASYRQAKILEKIKENYALMKVDERKKGYWFVDERPEGDREIICSNCEQPIFRYHKLDFDYRPNYCPNCGTEMKMKTEIIMSSEDV